jgi:hypothetical protein
MMAVRDMIDMAVSMLRPTRRDADRERDEDCIPMLEQAVTDFKALAYEVRASMLVLSGGPTFARAQDALNALATPYFRPEFTWGVDEIFLEASRANITSFYDTGHSGLVYVLQTKLLQAGASPTRDEITRLIMCKQRFMQQLDEMSAFGRLPFSFPLHGRQCQMFAPRELVRIPAVANHILSDRRPDFLGRLSFHVLSDAGANITWESPSQGGPSKSVYSISDNPFTSVEWPIQAMNNTDIFGRTVLHIAVRQDSINSVMTLSRVGANLHQLCLKGISLLHIAACHGHTTMVCYLIEKMNYHECIKQCHEAGEQCREREFRHLHLLDRVDDLWRTSFLDAARGSHFEVMKPLIGGVDLDVPPKDCFTARVNTEVAASPAPRLAVKGKLPSCWSAPATSRQCIQ